MKISQNKIIEMMNIRIFVFPIVAGVVIAIAGASIIEQPIKTIALLAVLCFTHEFSQGKKHDTR